MMVGDIHYLQEAHSCTLAITSSQAIWLQDRGIADVSPSSQSGCFKVTVKNVAGQVSYGGTTFSIAPKLPVRSVIWMIQQAMYLPRWMSEKTFLDEDSLISAMAYLYRTQLEHVLKSGFFHGYEYVQEQASVLRGRLLLNRQMNVHFGELYPFENGYQRFSQNIPLNQILLTAAVQLLHLVEQEGRSVSEILAYRVLIQRFEGVQVLVPGQRVPAVNINRLNQRYEGILRFAEMVLQQSGFSESAGEKSGWGFIVDMPRVFEAMVGNVLMKHYPAGTVRTQKREEFASLADGSHKIFAIPDVVRLSDGMVVDVLDTKYRRDEVKSSEMFQLNAYAQMFGLSDVSLVYGQQVEEITYEVGAGRRVHIRGIDLAAEPDEIEAQICGLFR